MAETAEQREFSFAYYALVSGLVTPQVLQKALAAFEIIDDDSREAPSRMPATGPTLTPIEEEETSSDADKVTSLTEYTPEELEFLARKLDETLLSDWLIQQNILNAWQAEQLQAGRTKFNLGIYRILDSIGRGGMGQVFLAEHMIMARKVAIKVLPKEKCTPKGIRSFHREIRTLAQLDHENLVRAYDAGADGKVHYLVTEYVPGSDLKRRIREQGPLTMFAAASVIAQAARGLAAAHREGIIHRDIKPANLLVTPEGLTKISDLGLASVLEDTIFPENPDEINSRGKRRIVGTADYLPPEFIRPEGKLSIRSDLYSLGCTLFFAVTGKVPYPGGKSSEKAKAHLQQPFPDPRIYNPQISPDFVQVIQKMAAKAPQDRYYSAEEVVRHLQPWLPRSFPMEIQEGFGAAWPMEENETNDQLSVESEDQGYTLQTRTEDLQEEDSQLENSSSQVVLIEEEKLYYFTLPALMIHWFLSLLLALGIILTCWFLIF
ncbi:Serine/threonine-protein kinase PknB [Planctomycetales bacterium 10988]|nr:Serine/threonine-protein kinase PknB [Planctomycetales bacterium 10988]